jgi:Tfp pilus assembly protein PilE
VKNRKSFTLLELLIGLCILAILITMSLLGYRYYMNKAKTTEAIVAVSQISKAEELLKMQNGTYVAADNTQQVNERLGMNISPKNFEYRVVGISDDNFIVIAQKIGLDISENMVPEPSALIVMDRSGPMTGGYQSYIGGESGVTGGQLMGGPGSDGGSRSGGSGSGGEGSSGGGAGGTSGGQRSSGGWYGAVMHYYNVDPNTAVERLVALTSVLSDAGGNALDTGKYYYDLIKDNNIIILETAFDEPDPDYMTAAAWDYTKNTIYVNSRLRTLPNWTEAAVASVILHEAVHADFDYSSAKWADRITEQWGSEEGFTAAELYKPDITTICNEAGDCVTNSLYYTQIQEYFTHSIQSAAWLEMKGDIINQNLDDIAAHYQSGEADLRNYIAGIPAYARLKEFYGNPDPI